MSRNKTHEQEMMREAWDEQIARDERERKIADAAVCCFDKPRLTASDKKMRPALYAERPAQEFWDGFAGALIDRGWTPKNVQDLIASSRIRHAWGDGGEVDALKAIGAMFAAQFARQGAIG